MVLGLQLGFEEYKVLYLCDDGLGKKDLLSSRVSVSGRELDRILKKLTKVVFIKYEDGWYYCTESGKKYLKKWGKFYSPHFRKQHSIR